MAHRSRLLMFAIALALMSSSAHAATLTFATTLLGSNEVPPNSSTATGTAMVTVTGDSLSVTETFTGLNNVVSGSHIHCCAPPGNNVQIALPFTGFPSATSGTYSNTFDLTLSTTYTSGFLTAEGGTAAGAEAALITALEDGQAYANIHDTPNFGGGEIRGWFVQTPLPGTLPLLVSGLGALGVLGWRRKRKVQAVA